MLQTSSAFYIYKTGNKFLKMNGKVAKTLASPQLTHFYPALALFENSAIYMTGGRTKVLGDTKKKT